MAEELVPGLVREIEERMGRLGRPFTTRMVIFAGLGVMAWGAEMVFNTVIVPILTLAGADVDSELAASIAILAMITAMFVFADVGTAYGLENVEGRGTGARLCQQEAEIADLRRQLESQDGSP